MSASNTSDKDVKVLVKMMEEEIFRSRVNALKKCLYGMGIKSAKPHPDFRFPNPSSKAWMKWVMDEDL